MAWTLLTSGILFLLVSAVQKDQVAICKEVLIDIDQHNGYKMIDDAEILSALWPEEEGAFPSDRKTISFDLFDLEKQIEKNPWVLSANMYFDQRDRMHINITQRVAVARVFDPQGNSYYLDSSHRLLPVKTNDIISLPVFTNFYFNTNEISGADSIAISRISSLARFIALDSFWMAQVESVNINPDNSFELVTQVGDQKVKLGRRDDWDNLFNKLKTLYLHLTENLSWSKYSSVDLQFVDQIVCVKKDFVAQSIDSSFHVDTLVSLMPQADTINHKVILPSDGKSKSKKQPIQ